MRAKDFCNCEHAQTLLEFIQEAYDALRQDDQHLALDTLLLGLKVHNTAKAAAALTQMAQEDKLGYE